MQMRCSAVSSVERGDVHEIDRLLCDRSCPFEVLECMLFRIMLGYELPDLLEGLR